MSTWESAEGAFMRRENRESRTETIVGELPAPDLAHLIRMTDDVGMLQHAKFETPDRWHGYCVDDNARALIVACLHHHLFGPDEHVSELIHTYLAFTYHAYNPEHRRFRNFMGYDRTWLEDVGSEDSHGRSLWGLTLAERLSPTPGQRRIAYDVLREAIPSVIDFTSPRAWAFTILALDVLNEDHDLFVAHRDLFIELSERIYRQFCATSESDWPWCEEIVTYGNARLAQAMIVAGRRLNDPGMLETGLTSLEWLFRVQTAPEGHLRVIGNDGWLRKGGDLPPFDQQPIEAMGLVDGAVAAYQASGNPLWLDRAALAWEWFLGRNDHALPLYDPATGGCRDGLQSGGVNENQGAESTLAYLISLLALHKLERDRAGSPGNFSSQQTS